MNNELVSLIVFMLSIYGGSNGIVYSTLLLPMRLWIMYKGYEVDAEGQVINTVERTSFAARFLSKLINCPLCMGFWLGIFYSLTIVSPCQLSTQYLEYSIPCMLFDGFLGSAAAWILHLLLHSRMKES